MAERLQHFTLEPTICISADGSLALEIVEYLGRSAHRNYDGTYLSFSVRTSTTEDTHLIDVLVDGFLLRVPGAIPERLRSVNTERSAIYLAEARLGEFLGEVGLPEFGLPGGLIPNIQLESARLQRWADMKRPTDEEIESYLRRKCLWGWRFNYPAVRIYEPDFIRLGTDAQNVSRLIDFGRDSEWVIEASTPVGFRIAGTEKMLRRERTKISPQPQASRAAVHREHAPYVASSRIEELEGLSSSFDLSKLVALCKELNICWRASAVHAVAALVRSVIDHVPPIFSAKTFAEVVNNYPGSRSFKDSMRHLEASARKIADAHLHTQIRKSEVLPTGTQVDFSRDLDVLLAEIVRVLK